MKLFNFELWNYNDWWTFWVCLIVLGFALGLLTAPIWGYPRLHELTTTKAAQ